MENTEDQTENVVDNSNPEVEQLNELKREAAELGIKVNANATVKSLTEKIEKFYADKEASAEKVSVRVGSVGGSDDPALAMRKLAKELEAKARKTRVVTIIDNDQRINNVATSCVANCSNAYFDLGTIILPLNEKVEVREGHLEALRSVKIPQHVKDPANPSVSRTVMRPRFSIQTEQV